jgi:hypothetical protein
MQDVTTNPELNMSETEACTYLNAIWGLPFGETVLEKQRYLGRGPRCRDFRTAIYHRDDLDKWASYCLGGARASGKGVWSRYRPKKGGGSPVHMLVVEKEPGGVAERFLSYGCDVVVPAPDARSILQAIESNHLEAGYVDMDWDMDGAVAVTDALAVKRVPFIFDTGLLEIPKCILNAGSVVGTTDWAPSLPELIKARFPERVVRRMNFANDAIRTVVQFRQGKGPVAKRKQSRAARRKA